MPIDLLLSFCSLFLSLNERKENAPVLSKVAIVLYIYYVYVIRNAFLEILFENGSCNPKLIKKTMTDNFYDN